MVRTRRGGTTVAALLVVGALGSAPVAADEHAAGAAPVVLLAAGDKVTGFDARGIDGAMRHVEFPKTAPTVLLIFSSGCPVCRRMIPIWNEQLQKKPKNLNVVGVIVDQEPPGFFNLIPASFPVVRAPGREMMERFKVARVPLTIRIKPGGEVESAAIGVLDPIKLGEIFRR